FVSRFADHLVRHSVPTRRSSDLLVVEHQVPRVGLRDDHALRAVESAIAADLEEALDLLVDPADRLHVAELVHGTGHGERLAQGQDRKSTRLNSSHVKISYAVFCL